MTRLSDALRAALREARLLWKQLLGIGVVTVALSSVSLFALNLATDGSAQMTAYLDESWAEAGGYTLHFDELLPEHFEIIKALDIRELRFFQNWSFEGKGNMEFTFGERQGLFFSLLDYGYLGEPSALSGREPGDTEAWESAHIPVWISNLLAEETAWTVGEMIPVSLRLGESEYSFTAELAGIFDNAVFDSWWEFVCFPFDFLSNWVEIPDIQTSLAGSGKLVHITAYRQIFDAANRNGFAVSGLGSLEEYLRGIEMTGLVCVTMAALLCAATVYIAWCLLLMCVKGRYHFIAVGRALGQSGSSAAAPYILLLTTVVALSSLLSLRGGEILGQRLEGTINVIYRDAEIVLHIKTFAALLAFGVYALMVLLFFLRLGRVLARLPVTTLLREEEEIS